MTREEKIKILKSRKEEVEADGYVGFAEALGSAIQALEKLEKIEQLIDNWTKTEELEWKIREVLDND